MGSVAISQGWYTEVKAEDTTQMMIEVLRKVIRRMHYPLEVAAERPPKASSVRSAAVLLPGFLSHRRPNGLIQPDRLIATEPAELAHIG
jgi:hypothetical protein